MIDKTDEKCDERKIEIKRKNNSSRIKINVFNTSNMRVDEILE